MKKNENPILNVYIVTYNRCKYLEESIQSVLRQSYSYFNLYILDNCSTDETEQIVKKFDDKRIYYIRHKKNLGGIGNINYAFNHNSQKYFVVFHDDDIMWEDMLKSEIEVLENNPSIAMVSCLSQPMDEDGNPIGNAAEEEKIIRFDDVKLFRDYLGKKQFVPFPTIMYRYEFFQSNNILLTPEVGPSADIKLSFDVERKGGTIAIINKALSYYRCHSGQDSVLSRASMTKKLFEFLWQDDYYSKLLIKYKNERKKYYSNIMYIEICLLISKKITIQVALKEEKMFWNSIRGSYLARTIFYLCVGVYRIMPRILNIVYGIKKGIDVKI